MGLAVGYGALQLGGRDDWPRIAAAELASQLQGGGDPIVVLDVRTPQEFATGHVPGARNVYFRDLPRRVDDLVTARDSPVVVYCETGARSRAAIRTLVDAGFTQVRQLDGDMVGWRRSGLPQQRLPIPLSAKSPGG
jgi:rhodanese-related sulfurtransferase